jgi:hypothetical protein
MCLRIKAASQAFVTPPVAKLTRARERRRAEGRKPLAETHPEAVALAKRLRRASPKTGELGFGWLAHLLKRVAMGVAMLLVSDAVI